MSLEDLVQFVERGDARSADLTDAIRDIFHGIDDNEVEQIKRQYKEFKDRIEQYAESSEAEESGDTYDSLLPDDNYANVLIERLRTPIGGKKHKLWIIDQ